MDPFTLVVLGATGYIAYKKWQDDQRRRKKETISPSIPPPKKVITLIGKTNAGKSSTANALLGRAVFQDSPTQTTTTFIQEAFYRENFKIRDTPGILDQINIVQSIIETTRDSSLIIYVTMEELLRPEIEIISKIYTSQQYLDKLSGTSNKRYLAIFINAIDKMEYLMTRSERELVLVRIRDQVASWIPNTHIVTGSAAPLVNGIRTNPNIYELEMLIDKHIRSF